MKPTPDAPQLERHEAEAMVEGLADMAAGRIRSLAEIDAPQVERFTQWCNVSHKHLLMNKSDGEWVRYTDYASLLAEKATRLADFKREEAAWNAALEKLRAEKARLEGENAALRDAVREWKDDLRAYHELETDAEFEALSECLSVAERALLAVRLE